MPRPPVPILALAAIVIALLTSGATASLTGSPAPVRYEAEAAATNLPNTETTWSGFSGTGYLCCWNITGQYATFTVTAPTAGTYDLGFGYSAVGAGASREILVNGAITQADQAFPQTTDWNTWSTLDVQASLNSGSNTVTVKFDASAGSSQYLNLDYLDVTPAPTSTPTPTPAATATPPQTSSSANRYEAENAATDLPNTETTWSGYSGTGYLCCWNSDGQYATFTINAPAAGTYNLGFGYSAAGAGTSREILVNGAITQANQAFPRTYDWNAWSTLTVQAALSSGSNTVTIKFDAAAGSAQYLNLDYLDVTPAPTPTPAATPAQTSGSANRLEGENAATNLPSTETRWSGYSGTGYLCCWNRDGQYATFTVSAPAAGTYNLGFGYSAVGAGASREILVNGAITQANQAFPKTPDWNTWSTLRVQATLSSGSNTVTVKFDSAAGSSQYLNLDYLDVTRAPAAAASPTPTPTQTTATQTNATATPTPTPTPAQTTATPTPSPTQPAAAAQASDCTAASYVCSDPASFPKLAEYLFATFNPTTLSHFALNVGRGCEPEALDQSHALNPNQVNLIVPGTSVASGDSPGPGCGAEPGFATTYGTGYWNDTSTITDSNPAIGTIRPINMAAGADRAVYADGTMPSDSVLNLFSSGTSDSTAEWAARLKAHWTLQDLGGSFSNHPGVQGVWGDNFDWWNPYIAGDKNSTGSSLAGTGAAWDNGLVRNAQVMRSALGSNVILGGNGASWTCPTGGSFSTYVGTISNGNCTAADAGMWENVGGNEYTASAWDWMIPTFNSWIQAGSSVGRAKYGVVPLYGTCGVGNLGHPLTAQDERMGLALATIGGVDLWAVHDCDWETTAVPGGQYSIPEMGDNATYPRGWLGHPTAGPQRVALGEWKRSFSGGTVYANVTGAAWSADGHTVPADDALFVKS